MFLPIATIYAENQRKELISGLDLWKAGITTQTTLLK
jgi:hypothetical protein